MMLFLVRKKKLFPVPIIMQTSLTLAENFFFLLVDTGGNSELKFIDCSFKVTHLALGSTKIILPSHGHFFQTN